MKRTSPHKRVNPSLVRSSAWIALTFGTLAATCPALAQSPSSAPDIAEQDAHPVVLTVPLLDGSLYLGDVPVTVIDGQTDVEAPSGRLLDLLEPVLEAAVFAQLRRRLEGKDRVRPSELNAAGVQLRYQSETVALVADIPQAARASRTLSLGSSNSALAGDFEEPARVSAYLSARGAVHASDNSGTRGLVFLDGAARLGQVVLESDAVWQTGGGVSTFERRGTRLVLDRPERALRFAAGDLVTASRGFQSAPDLAGLSLVRSYAELQPYRNVRPNGRRAFAIDSPSVVEVFVNEQLLRRIELPPGAYDLRDFPFAQGANNVRLTIRDGSGRIEDLRFDTFLDQSQLTAGLDEFGVFIGVHAPPGFTGPEYSRDLAATAYYRRGVNDDLTIGANLQGDSQGQMAGLQSVLASPFGTWRVDAAASRDGLVGGGTAVGVSFARVVGAGHAASSVVSFSLEAATRNFRSIGPGRQAQPYAWQLDGQYVHGFSSTLSAGVSLRLAKGWRADERVQSYHGHLDWLIAPRLRLSLDAGYEEWGFATRGGTTVRVGLRYRIGQASSGSLEYDSDSRAARLAYSRSAGDGVGSYSLLTEAEQSPDSLDLNADATYVANRAELGFSRFTNLEGTGGSTTTLRMGSALAFADGAWAVGPPVNDSFAIVTRHRSLAGSDIRIDESEYGYAAATGRLGTALRAGLSSYLERTLAIQSPDAPATANLGSGAFRVLPPYRSGYRLQVGSDYSVSVTGRLMDRFGRPLALLAGVAREDRENGAVVEIFTNAEGRFGAANLRPGRWRLEFKGEAPLTYVIDIGPEAGTVVGLGALHPIGEPQ